jgi:hypothetical protein
MKDVYYLGTEEQWKNINFSSKNNSLFNATIHYNSTGATYSLRSNLSNVMSFAMTNTSDLTVYNATASNAILGNEYVIVVLNSTADINDFTNNDLLYIDQKTAETDGDITFNYVPKTNDDCIVYIIGIFSDTNSVKQELITPTNSNEPENPDYNFNFYIQQPSRTKIRNMDGIYLYAVIDGVAPEGSYIEWERSNMNFITGDEGDGVYFVTADDKGYTTFTAILYDADGNDITDKVALSDVIALYKTLITGPAAKDLQAGLVRLLGYVDYTENGKIAGYSYWTDGVLRVTFPYDGETSDYLIIEIKDAHRTSTSK